MLEVALFRRARTERHVCEIGTAAFGGRLSFLGCTRKNHVHGDFSRNFRHDLERQDPATLIVFLAALKLAFLLLLQFGNHAERMTAKWGWGLFSRPQNSKPPSPKGPLVFHPPSIEYPRVQSGCRCFEFQISHEREEKKTRRCGNVGCSLLNIPPV